ncbi:MAG: 3-isopropylmalate dehydratase large subunit [Candidatus Omnitrophica bacterium]|nr:3-isopropylmalate dehydratase large subunit [Candidatus Omnitrophota bacterium]MCM8829299.1 3-isopropylmalate dehydratase large subunit [Candidatus Omnitrophota bacterium]
MGQTIAEKILSSHAGKPVFAGEICVARVDFLMAQDGTAPLVIRAFEELNGDRIFDPEKICFVFDHSAPSPNMGVSALHKLMRDFVRKYGIKKTEIGEGVCHVLMPEKGFLRPGQLVLGADSHTPTYGAMNLMACGVGSTDLAIAMLTGKQWFKVPHTTKIVFYGKLNRGVFAKDMGLLMVKTLTARGAVYQSVEITGEATGRISMDGRFTIANLVTEIGGKNCVMEYDEKTENYIRTFAGDEKINPVFADKDASYSNEIEMDVSKLEPLVAKPHTVDNVCEVEEVRGTKINQAFIGTCTNGRIEDLAVAAKILKGRKVHSDVRAIITPGSRKIYLEAMKKGYIKIFMESGCCVTNPGCGPCVGTHQGVPSDGEVVISTANRNFKGRMGNPQAFIYLASPATVAASAVKGEISDPREFL